MRRLSAWFSFFYSVEGRLRRRDFVLGLFALGALLGALDGLLSSVLPARTAVAAAALASALCLTTRRCHDRGHSAWWLSWAALPVIGPLWLGFDLLVRRSTEGDNQYGADPTRNTVDYLTVEDRTVPGERPSTHVDEVTRLHRTEVFAVAQPRSVQEVRDALARTHGPVSIGGGRFSMGGQVASPGSLHLDMRGMNRILELSLEHRTIRVEPGVRWCDVQKAVDPHGLAVAIMQSYANFTVGGSLSVNVHGRYVGAGPLVLSVRSLEVVLADGRVVRASRTERPDVFFGVVGGYGALGVVVSIELRLDENLRLLEVAEKLETRAYVEHFKRKVRDQKDAVLHNADLYGPHHRTLRSVTWVRTMRPVTHGERLMPPRASHAITRYLAWAMSETPFGAQRRERLIDPLRYATRRVHHRNYEAGYDVRELEPPSRLERTYVLQEYFVPVDRFDDFVARMGEILRRHAVNVLNISVRHAMPDDGTLLAWAPEEVFAFVLYYKQRTRPNARRRVAVWTRELVEAALECGGRHYLPYQAHATPAQFHRAYPRAGMLFELKRSLDPDFRFRNVLWDRYYAPWLAAQSADADGAPPGGDDAATADAVASAAGPRSEFADVYGDVALHDAFYRFLQNIYHLYPDDRFHQLIAETTQDGGGDETIYRRVQERLPTIAPPLAALSRPLFYMLPALAVQKAEMVRQTAELVRPRLGGRGVEGYVEIGTTGRYVRGLKRALGLRGPVHLVSDAAPAGPVDVVERGQLAQAGAWVPLADYEPLPEARIASGSVQLVSCFIGLHHVAPERLSAFIASIHRVLAEGGLFVLRDHDVSDPSMERLVSLAHTVFNCGLGEPYAVNAAERRHFAPIDVWVARIEAAGFTSVGPRLAQANDPTRNLLVAFEKQPAGKALTP